MGKCAKYKEKEATWVTEEGKLKFYKKCKTNICTPPKWRKSNKEAAVAKNNVIDGERLGDQPVIVQGVKITVLLV